MEDSSNRRLPKIPKFEYLSNHCSDLTQPLNLCLYDHAKLAYSSKCFKRRQPKMQEDFKWNGMKSMKC